MATAETVELSEAHAPKDASVTAFEDILPSLKHELVKLRRDHDSTSFPINKPIKFSYSSLTPTRTRARVLPRRQRPLRRRSRLLHILRPRGRPRSRDSIWLTPLRQGQDSGS